MKRKTWLIIDDESKLIAEEVFDEIGNVVYEIQHNTNPLFERETKHDGYGNQVKIVEWEDSREVNRAENLVNENGDVYEHRLYFSGELYEQKRVEFNSNGYVETVKIEGEKTSRTVMEGNETGHTISYYQYGNLVGKEVYYNNPKTDIIQKKFFDELGNLTGIVSETYDVDSFLVNEKEEDAKGNLLTEIMYEIDGGKVLSSTYKDYNNPDGSYKQKYEYDERGNLIRHEVLDMGEGLLEFHIKSYDEADRVIEEAGGYPPYHHRYEYVVE